MSGRIWHAALWLVPILVVMLFPFPLSGQSAAKAAQERQSLTGCSQKGEEPGGFVLMGDDGKTWELTSRNVKMADHVGHKVTVVGSPIQESKEHEEKMEKNEKKESGGKQYADFKISSLDMVSDSCK